MKLKTASLLLVGILALGANAATRVWTTQTGNWSDSANWADGALPEAGDDVALVGSGGSGGNIQLEGATTVALSGGFCSSPESGRCLRELNLARALYACGDHEGVAKKILENYAADGRGVFALHARALLGR